LESKITLGNKGGVLAEVNRNLKLENDFYQNQNEKLVQDFHTYEDKLAKQSQEIAVFSRALELKVEEFRLASVQMDVDIKAALLYDLGFQRESQIKVKKSN